MATDRTAGSQHPVRRVLPTVAALVLATVASFVVLDALVDEGLVRGVPWLLTALLVLAVLGGADVARHPVAALEAHRRLAAEVRPRLRLALVLVLAAAFLWHAGWPQAFPACATLACVVHVEAAGSRMWRLSVLATMLGTAAGQALVALGLLGTVVPPEASHVGATLLLVLGGVTIAYVGRSVAQREELTRSRARSEARLNALMNSSTDVIAVVDRAGVVQYVSPAATVSLGHKPERLVGTPVLDLVDRDQRADVAAVLRRVAGEGPGTRESFDVMVELATHERRWFEWTTHNLLEDPLVEGIVVDLRDVSDRLLHQEALEYAAAHDPLTGLANRAELMRRLEDALPQAAEGAGVGLLFLDLDRFKAVNDTHGHVAGDELLVTIARRLRSALRPDDHVARLGGDEFCAVVTEVTDTDALRTVARRVEEALGQPVRLRDGTVVEVGASVGTAVATDPYQDPVLLFAEADASMYRTKHAR